MEIIGKFLRYGHAFPGFNYCEAFANETKLYMLSFYTPSTLAYLLGLAEGYAIGILFLSQAGSLFSTPH